MMDYLLEFIDNTHNYFNKIKHPDVDTEKQILYRSMKLSEEIWEFNEQIFTYLGKWKKEKLENFDKKNLEDEFADVILSACLVAKSCDIDINKAIENKIEILKKRFKF